MDTDLKIVSDYWAQERDKSKLFSWLEHKVIRDIIHRRVTGILTSELRNDLGENTCRTPLTWRSRWDAGSAISTVM